jgi:hypothetical protein
MSHLHWSAIALLLGGCAFSYVDPQGRTRTMGLMSVTETTDSCALVQTVTTAGISLDTTPSTAGLSMGYRSVTTTRAPESARLSFALGRDGQLLAYLRDAAPDEQGRPRCP